MTRTLLTLLTGLILGLLLSDVSTANGQAPTITIPPDFRDDWWVCSLYTNRQADCATAGYVRHVLATQRR